MAKLQFHSLTIPAAVILACGLGVGACGRGDDAATNVEAAGSADAFTVPESLSMGGERSVMSFFVTSRGTGSGGDLGGLSGADAHCQALAEAEYAGDRAWRAYLSTTATDTTPAVNARDRIGRGPWYNGAGLLIAANLEELHDNRNRLNKDTALTEKLEPVNGAGDTPNQHDILTGSRADGTAFDGGEDLTCGNWTSSDAGQAQVGHHDRRGLQDGVNSWNSVHASSGCSQSALENTGGAGLLYCFAAD